MTDADIIKQFVDDLNWINNTLHDFAICVAFVEVVEDYHPKHQELKDIALIMNIYNSMANDAVAKINNIYDGHKDALSVHDLLNWIRANTPLIKSHVHALNLSFSEKDISLLERKIGKSSKLIKKFNTMRNKLISHNDKKIVRTTDIRRKLLNNKSITTRDAFIEASKTYMEELQGFLLNKEDFITMKNFTIDILMDIKSLLKMPDRIFGQSGNEQEWEEFYKSKKGDVSRFFALILLGLSNSGRDSF